jgi:hypothetical protein
MFYEPFGWPTPTRSHYGYSDYDMYRRLSLQREREAALERQRLLQERLRREQEYRRWAQSNYVPYEEEEEYQEQPSSDDEHIVVKAPPTPRRRKQKRRSHRMSPKHIPIQVPNNTPRSSVEEDVAPVKADTHEIVKKVQNQAAQVIQRAYRRHQVKASVKSTVKHLQDLQVLRQRACELQDRYAMVFSKPLVFENDHVSYKECKEFLMFEDGLLRLMLSVDGVESNGDAIVRDSRKALVRLIQKMLDQWTHIDRNSGQCHLQTIHKMKIVK